MRVILATVFVFLAITNSSPGEEILRYKGEILSLEKPLLVRYRPHPKSRTTRTMITSSQGSTTRTVTTGYVEMVAEGSSLVRKLEIQAMQIEKGGGTQKLNLDIKIQVRMMDRGKILSVDIDAPPPQNF